MRIVFLLVCCAACRYEPLYVRTEHREISADFRTQASEFVVACAAAPRHHHAEEGAELVAQCERTAVRLYGSSVFYCEVDRDLAGVQRYRCDSNVNDACRRVCGGN